MGENQTRPKVPDKGDPDSDGQGGGPGSSRSGKLGKVKGFALRLIGKVRKVKGFALRLIGKVRKNFWRFLVLLGGLAAIGGGLFIWLAPLGSTSATENTTTTVTDGAGHKSTTVVQKNTASKSDTMLLALFTAGVGLLAVGALWDRIREVGFGNLSIKLTEVAVEQQDIPLAAARVDKLDELDNTAPRGIADEVRNLPKDLMLARMDLERPGINPQEKPGWAPTNLKFYVLMLASHSSVKVLIFTGQADYFGAAPVAWLADRVARRDPALFAAYQTANKEPFESQSDAMRIGEKFYNELFQDGNRPNDETVHRVSEGQVDRGWLKGFAGDALITQPIKADLGQSLSRQEQLEVLAFPLVFVPITDRLGRFDSVLDKRRIAQTLGFSAIGSSTSTT
jgi:hypothetical protein